MNHLPGFTPLHLAAAARGDAAEAMKLLVAAGADVEAEDGATLAPAARVGGAWLRCFLAPSALGWRWARARRQHRRKGCAPTHAASRLHHACDDVPRPGKDLTCRPRRAPPAPPARPPLCVVLLLLSKRLRRRQQHGCSGFFGAAMYERAASSPRRHVRSAARAASAAVGRRVAGTWSLLLLIHDHHPGRSARRAQQAPPLPHAAAPAQAPAGRWLRLPLSLLPPVVSAAPRKPSPRRPPRLFTPLISCASCAPPSPPPAPPPPPGTSPRLRGKTLREDRKKRAAKPRDRRASDRENAGGQNSDFVSAGGCVGAWVDGCAGGAQRTLRERLVPRRARVEPQRHRLRVA